MCVYEIEMKKRGHHSLNPMCHLKTKVTHSGELQDRANLYKTVFVTVLWQEQGHVWSTDAVKNMGPSTVGLRDLNMILCTHMYFKQDGTCFGFVM